jgi:hypothetical protein
MSLAAPNADLSRGLQSFEMCRYLPVHPTLSDAFNEARGDHVIELREVSMPPEASSLARVRSIVRDLWLTADTGREEVVLVADELVANVLEHVGQRFMVSLARKPEHLIVAVSDPSRSEPTVMAPSWDSPGGRGMHIVESLSEEWGVRWVHDRGKTVWARVRISGQ